MDYEAASYPFAEHGKSMILGETLGFAKLLCEPRGGKLLGAHIVGPEASELIHERSRSCISEAAAENK